MQRSTSLSAALLVWIALGPSTASAACYSMYDARNALVYQSSTSPIDLSRTVSEQMSARFPSRALVISTTTSCADDIAGSGTTSRYIAAGDTGALAGSTNESVAPGGEHRLRGRPRR